MKSLSRSFLVVMVTAAMLVTACGGVSAESETSAGSGRPLASLVEVAGFIESINGNQWVINGQIVTVDPSMLGDDTKLVDFKVGDYVEIEAEVSTDGSLVATEVSSTDDGNENDDSNSNDDDDSNDNGDDSNDNNDDSNDNGDDSNDNDDNESNDNDDNESNDNDDSNDNSNGNDG